MDHLFTSLYRHPGELARLATSFAAHDLVILPDLLTPAARAELEARAEAAHRHAKRLDLTMPGWLTPRHLWTIGARTMAHHGLSAVEVYEHPEVLPLVQAITGDATRATHPFERIAINWQRAGDTHGWHVDDPPYALLFALKAPSPGNGGELETLRDWPEPARAALPVGARPDNAHTETRALKAGDGYLLRADRTLHRVRQLAPGDPGMRRIVMSLAFEGATPTVYGDSSNVLHAGEMP